MIDTITTDDLYLLHSKSEKDVVNLMYTSLFGIKPIEVVNEDLLEISKTNNTARMFEADFSIVRKFIKLVDQPDKLILRFPVLDERENPDLQMNMFTNDRNDVLPINNYFLYVFTRVIQHPFGLVEIQYIGQHIRKNDNDFNHIRFEHVFRESEYLYYDFENHKYLQIDSEKLIEVKNKKKRGKSVDEAEIPESVKIYLHRQNLLNTGKFLLRDTGNKFLKEIIEMRNGRGNTGSTIQTKIYYLDRYDAFLNELETGLKIHLIFANVSVREYQKLDAKTKELRQLVVSLKTKLETELVDLMVKSGRYGYVQEKIKTTILSLHKDSEESRLYDDEIVPGLEVFKSFLTANTGNLELEGYIDFDLELWELYPNIAQVEKRRNLNTVSTNDGKERDRENKILKLQKKNAATFQED